LFFLINFTNSGCLIYPLSFTCFENFSWSVTLESVQRYNNWYQLWSKAGAAPNYRVENPEEYIKYFNWVKNWMNNYVFIKVPDTLAAIFLIITYFLLALRKKKYSINKSTYRYLSLYFFIILFFFLWFYKHPDLRYGGYGLLVSLFFIPLGLYLSKLLRIRTKPDKESEKRHLMQFEFKETEFSESTLVLEENESRNYTQAYKEFTKDYYLNF
jgi:hypothetical protein